MCNEIQRHRRNPVREILLRPTFSLMDFTTFDGVFTLHGTRGGTRMDGCKMEKCSRCTMTRKDLDR